MYAVDFELSFVGNENGPVIYFGRNESGKNVISSDFFEGKKKREISIKANLVFSL